MINYEPPAEPTPLHVRWHRVGNQAAVGHLDITGLLDLEAIEERVRAQVAEHLHGDFAVRVELRTMLDGGPWLNMPFGYGSIEVELPKAATE